MPKVSDSLSLLPSPFLFSSFKSRNAYITSFFLSLSFSPLLLFPPYSFLHRVTADATKFKEEFDRCKVLSSSPTKPAAEDKLTEEMDKLKVEDKAEEEKDASSSCNSDPKTSESSGEGVKAETAESGTTAATDNAQDSAKKDDEQTDQQSGPAEWLR